MNTISNQQTPPRTTASPTPAAPGSRGLVVGGGAFGTALALVLARNGFAHVDVWVRNEEQANEVNECHENKRYLPGTILPSKLHFTSNLAYASKLKYDSEEESGGLKIVIFAIPTQFLRPLLEAHRSTFPVGVPLVQSAKGIEVETLKTPFDIMQEELPGKYSKHLCVLGGPSFAKEMAKNLSTYVSVAAPDPHVAEKVQSIMSSRDAQFRCYANVDYIGCEIAGAVKNVLAIASGASTGFGLGLNARAGLICRGLAEMSRLARACGSSLEAMSGLAGVGDLLLTCSSEMSRNFMVGSRLAKGELLKDILASTTTVAEGIASAQSIHDLSQKLNVDMPICEQVYAVLYEGSTVAAALQALQERPLCLEH